MAEPNATFQVDGICSAEEGCIELYGSPQAVTFYGSVTDGDIELTCNRCATPAVAGKKAEPKSEPKTTVSTPKNS